LDLEGQERARLAYDDAVQGGVQLGWAAMATATWDGTARLWEFD
jgi:hypothetical protein